MFDIFGAINNCLTYSHLIGELETIDKKDLIDVIELKLELISASISEDELEVGDERLERKATIALLLDKINLYKELRYTYNTDEEDITDIKIEIVKLLLQLI